MGGQKNKKSIFPRPKDSDLRKFYQVNPDKFTIADSIKVRHIKVRTWKEMDRLSSIVGSHKSIDDSEFVRLVKNHSSAPDKERDGDLGIVLNPRLNRRAALRR